MRSSKLHCLEKKADDNDKQQHAVQFQGKLKKFLSLKENGQY